MHDHKVLSRKRELGVALAIGMILLAVATVLGIAALRSTVTEERIAGNQRQIADAFLAAEAGVANAVAWFDAGNHSAFWGNEEGTITGINARPNETRDGIVWTIIDVIYETDDDGFTDKVTIISKGIVPTGVERLVSIDYRRPLQSGPLAAFLVGLLSDKTIRVNGDSAYAGGAHANLNFDQKGGLTLNTRPGMDEDGDPITIKSNITASGTAGATGGVTNSPANGTVTGGVGSVFVPTVSSYIEAVKAGEYGTYVEQCEFPTGGDLDGKIYYCDGPVTIGPTGKGKGGGKGGGGAAVEIYNGTIVSSGSVTVNGSSNLGSEDELTLMIAATGQITKNGADTLWGMLWSDSTVTQNGASDLNGAIVAVGNITRNGAFNFTQVDKFSANLPIPTAPGAPSAVTNWMEL